MPSHVQVHIWDRTNGYKQTYDDHEYEPTLHISNTPRFIYLFITDL